MKPRDPAQPHTSERRGLVCQRCGCGHFRVIYTRPTRGGRIIRRRECRHCGRRVLTAEEVRG
jgi:transcriptional regulator NrdR family protein